MTETERQWYVHGEAQGFREALLLALEAASDYGAPLQFREALERAYWKACEHATNPDWRAQMTENKNSVADVLLDMRAMIEEKA